MMMMMDDDDGGASQSVRRRPPRPPRSIPSPFRPNPLTLTLTLPQSFSGQSGGDTGSSRNSSGSSTGATHGATPALSQAREVLAAAAGRASSSSCRGYVSVNCLQTFPRRCSGGRRGEAAPGGYGSAVVDVMGEGMETLTLPKLVVQGSGLEEVRARAEGYGVLARLREP